MDVVSLTQDLVRCPSVTPVEGGALRLLHGILSEAGFTSELATFEAPGTPDVTNLYARIGTKPPYLLFAGHTDVVPTGPEASWRFPPFSAHIAEGKIFGRGSEDMKSGVAATIIATLEHIKQHGPPQGSIGFLITGDEEGPAINGTPALLEWATKRGEQFDHCLLAEPSSKSAVADTIKIGRRGSFSATLTVTGKQGHVAYPHKANNPIPHLMKLLQALQPKLDDGTQWFQPSNLEVINLDVGNTAFNVIPRSANARFNVRFNDTWTLETLEQDIIKRLNAAAVDAEWSLEQAQGNSEAFRTEFGDFIGLISDAAQSLTGIKPDLSTGGGTSDARFIKSYCPVVELGLISSTLHQVDECAPIADLEKLTAIYRKVIELYFKI